MRFILLQHLGVVQRILMSSTEEISCICRCLHHLDPVNSFMSNPAMLPLLQTMLTNLKLPLSLTKGRSTRQMLFWRHLCPEIILLFMFIRCVASKEFLVKFVMQQPDRVNLIVRTSSLKSSEVCFVLVRITAVLQTDSSLICNALLFASELHSLQSLSY